MRRRKQSFKQKALLVMLLAAGMIFGGMACAAGAPLIIEVIKPQAETAAQTGDKPRILLYHTHTWEAYEMTEETQYMPTETWRTKDTRYNMVRIGEYLAQCLREQGFEVVHDQTAFEPPNLSSAYNRSLEMLMERFERGEQYDYIFDVHRDAYSGPYNGGNAA